MTRKIFDNNLVAVGKNKVTLTLNKAVHVSISVQIPL